MSGEQVFSAVMLAVLLGALICIPLGIIADARAQRAHEDWERRWSQWLKDGMNGPAPR